MKKFNYLILLLIVLAGAFLRVYKISQALNFSGELGDNLWQVRTLIVNHEFPLYGPPTSHPWLFFSPFYYWLLIPVEKLANYNPLGAVYLGEFLGIGLILVNFLTIKELFSNSVALVSSFFMAISPLWISFSRDARFYFWTVLFFYPLFYLLVKTVKEKKNYYLLTGLILGLMLGFHYSPVIFFPVLVIYFWLFRKAVKVRKLVNFLVGIIFTFIPLLIYDSRQKFTMFKNLALWFPYRIAGFLGLYPKNQLDVGSVATSLQSLVQMVGSSFVQSSPAWIFLTILFFVALTAIYFRNSRDPRYVILFFTVIFAVLASVIHGDSPIHYFLPIFPVPIILGAVAFNTLNRRRGGMAFQVILVVLLTTGSGLAFRNQMARVAADKTSLNPQYVPYTTQLAVAKSIVQDARGQAYSIRRVGPDDYFPWDYSQNYRYLLWYFGNKPQDGQKIQYTIIEDWSRIPKFNGRTIMFLVNDIMIIKS